MPAPSFLRPRHVRLQVETRARGTALMRPESSRPRARPADAALADAAVRAYLIALSVDPWWVGGEGGACVRGACSIALACATVGL